MMEKRQLRQADFVTSVILIGFAIWVLTQALQMPMRDTYGGVTNVWYVSPALFPLFISIALFVLGVLLLVHSIRSGGAAAFMARLRQGEKRIPESFIRFGAILLAFMSYVYLDIPRVDFYLSTVLFLLFFISAFYFDDDRVLHKLALAYLAMQGVILLIFATGLAGLLNRAFQFSTDVVALVILVALTFTIRRMVGSDQFARKRFRVTAIVAFGAPLIVVPVFRYALLVPMPVEGGIIEIWNLIYYSLR